MAETIYLDNGATTKVALEVVKAMNKFHSESYGNASSIHHKGQEAKRALEEARHTIAKSIGAKDQEIIFTSGGTESNNFAIKGIAFANKNKGKHIITTKIEHDCVLNSCKWLEKQGFQVTYLNVDKEGFINPEELEKSITNKTILVSVIHGNNEIGTIQNLQALYEICKKHKIYFHTDACQSYTKTELSAKNADLITLNAHKIHGPKGVGVLYIKKGTKITPLAHGGGHERNLRSGTENIPGIIGFAKAVKLAINKKHINSMAKLRDYFIEQALKIPDTRLNGPKGNKRLCNNINISFRYIEGESIGAYLDVKGICTSTGSACSSKSLEPSHVLMALEKNSERAHGSLRFTISRFTTKQELDFTLKELKNTVQKLRKISPLTKILKRI
ncbi:cysteine desulfurase [Candidatus Woesearchaeota archaeon]|nr:cysteine desulfurase [Candidatus Woesearchaeota archaeon]